MKPDKNETEKRKRNKKKIKVVTEKVKTTVEQENSMKCSLTFFFIFESTEVSSTSYQPKALDNLTSHLRLLQ